MLLMALVFLVAAGQQARGATIYMPYTYDDDNPRTATISETTTLTYQGNWTEEEMSYPAFIYLVPKTPGEKVKITFASDGSTFPPEGQLLVYDGQKDLMADWNWSSLPASPKGTVKAGTVVESTAADGSLTVAFYEGSGEYYKWTSTVEVIASKDMEFSSISPSTIASQALIGAAAQPLGAVNVKMDGSNNALSVTGITMNVTSANASKFANLKVMYGGSKAAYDAQKAVAFTGTQVLAGGDNYFWLVGDVDASATVGDAVAVECSSVKIGDREKLTAPVSTNAVKISNTVVMPKSGTYAVGNASLSFYDDGGKDGKISSKFTGTVTFTPADPSKKVQIDFSKIGLYESSYGSDTYNDKLYVYNGRTATDENLNRQLFNNETAVVKSAADDGSLTVKLTSVTGVPGDGFEAAVSQFTPKAMEFSGIAAEQYAEGTVSAGDTDRPILSVAVTTKNTSPALTASKFSFTTAGTSANVKKATVYYTGINKTFSTAKKVGEAAVSGDAFEVVATEPVNLVEGTNYFWLAYDIADAAKDGTKVDASVASVTLSDGEHAVADGNPAGDLEVRNVVYATIGTQTRTVYGSILFKDQHYESSTYDVYDPEVGDRIVTFLPSKEGNVVQLDFSDFDVAYSSSSYYGVQAKFEIYSGKTAKGTPLWKLASADESSTGPGKTLRSASVDGALTVVFNTMDSSPYYAGKGWTATASEYTPKPMEVASVAATQTSSAAVRSGAKNEDIIGITVTTEGAQDPISLSKVKISLKGSGKNVDKVYLYTSGTEDTPVKETPIAEAVPGEGDALELVPTTAVTLGEGANYFYVTYDVKASAPVNAVLDAALTSVTVGGADKTPAEGAGDPEGSRVVKNLYTIQNGATDVVTVGDPMMFYDDGGADGNYSKSFKGTVTFVPADPTKLIRMDIKKFEKDSSDDFYVYYGGEVTASEDVEVGNDFDTSQPIVSKSADGKLTVQFRSYSFSTPKAGWEIQVTQYEPQPLAVTKVTTEAVAPEKVFKGENHVGMLRVAVTVDGDNTPFDVTCFVVNSGNTSVLGKVNVFATGHESKFFDGNLCATADPANATTSGRDKLHTAEGKYTISDRGTYYFFVAYDILPDAAAERPVVASLKSLTAAGSEHTPETAVKASTTVKEGFHGTYTIGKGGDYASFKDAMDAVKGGVDGKVVFNVKTGEYNELVTIPEIPGASENNTVTVQSESGNYGDVKVYYDTYTEPSYSDDSMAKEYGVITVDGADWVILRGLTVTTADVSFPAVVHLRNTSRHVTIDRCHVFAEMTTSYSEDINLIDQYTNNETANTNNDYMTVSNSLLEGGYVGVYINGNGYVAMPKQRGAVVENNTIRNQGSKGIYLMNEAAAAIRGNVIENNATNKSGFQGIDAQPSETLLLEGNAISLATANSATALSMREPKNVSAENQIFVTNNEIQVASAASGSYGINFSDRNGAAYVNIANNTVRMTGKQTGYGTALYSRGPLTNSRIANNIFQGEEEGLVYSLPDGGFAGVKFESNLVNTNGANVAKAGSTNYDFAGWATASGEKSPRNGAVKFVSDQVLVPDFSDTAVAALVADGTAVDFVKTDINGIARAAAPTLGCYEYNANAPVPAFAEGYPTVSDVKYVTAAANVQTTAAANVYVLVKPAAEAAPMAEEVVASKFAALVRQGKLATIGITGLENNTEYKTYFVLRSLYGKDSEVVVGPAFTTGYEPTKVSTFENVKTADGGFTDGTAAFAGFTVETVDDAVVDGTKAAKFSTAATVTLTNSTKGLQLTGFFLKSTKPVTMTVADEKAATTDYSVAATAGEWKFINLKDKGLITAVTLVSEADAWIDNFSGEPLALAAETADQSVAKGTEVTLGSAITGGVEPYAITWTDAAHKAVAAEGFTPDESGDYLLTVTDAWGATASAVARVVVTGGEAGVATFENLYLDSESAEYGKSLPKASFVSGSFAFPNVYYPEWNSWGNFAYSNSTSTDYTGDYLTQQFNSSVGSGVNGSKNFGVAYGGLVEGITVLNNAEGDVIRGFYVANAAWTKDAILNGDGLSTVPGGFAKGDYLKLTVTGTKADGTTKSLDYYLADYRAEKEADRYLVDTWQWVDLRSLGKVKNVAFSLETTKKNSYGATTPQYFCLDDFNGHRNIADKPARTIALEAQEFQLSDFFSLEDNGSTIVYQIVDDYDTTVADFSIADGILTATGKQDKKSVSIVVSATQQGKTYFARIPFEVDATASGVNNAFAEGVSVYPVPAVDKLNISTSLADYTIEVVSASGVTVLRRDNNSGKTAINVDNLAKGIYFLKLYSDGNTVIKRFIVK